MTSVLAVYWNDPEPASPSDPVGKVSYVEELTEREREVLGHVAVGKTLDQVAGLLGISRNTAHTHLKRIYEKLRISSRGEATIAAARLRLIRF